KLLEGRAALPSGYDDAEGHKKFPPRKRASLLRTLEEPLEIAVIGCCRLQHEGLYFAPVLYGRKKVECLCVNISVPKHAKHRSHLFEGACILADEEDSLLILLRIEAHS